MTVLFVDVEVEGGAGQRVRLGVDRIEAVGASLRPFPDEEVVDGEGGALIPGLHDHHLHLRSLAAEQASVVVGPPAVDGLLGLAAVLRSAAAASRPDAWLRAVGYHESVAGPLDRWALDRLVADRPVRVQHRSGALWMLNSLAVERVDTEESTEPGIERDADGRATGRLWRMDRWLAGRIPPVELALGALSRSLLAMGVTGFTDATPDRPAADLADLVHRARSGEIVQRAHLMAPVGAAIEPTDRASLGPVKLLLDDGAGPSLDEVVELAQHAHAEDRGLAVHCVTAAQLAFTLAALDTAGVSSRDRIEHGSVISPALAEGVARLGLTVITQPNFVAERGDRYLIEVDPADRAHLYPAASLVRAGVRIAAGTDAPFGRPDPWAAVRAAISRRTAAGEVLGREEALAPAAALALFAGGAEDPARPRSVAVGQPADVCLLVAPLADVLHDPDASAVRIARVGAGP